MNKEYEELKHDLITYCNSRNRSIYDCTVEFFTDRLSKLQEENAQLLLLRTEAYHEVHKLKEENERLNDKIQSYTNSGLIMYAEIESIKGKLKESDELLRDTLLGPLIKP